MGTFKVEGDINITGSKTNINYGTLNIVVIRQISRPQVV